MKRILLAVATSLALAGCGEAKIDGSSDAALKDSVEKVAKGLPSDKQTQFREDVVALTLSQVSLADVISGKKTAGSVTGDARKTLDGKTGEQVMAQAAQLRLEREKREREQALAEIQELLAKQASAESAVAELKKFAVTKSRFHIEPEKYSSRGQPQISIAVSNDTAHPISRAYFKGTIASPGRSVPWFTDTFNYQIPGGLEPGEKAEWELLPNQFGDWGRVNAPADAIFTVEVVRLDGPDEKPLFRSDSFSKENENRLEQLQKKYSGS